MSTDQPSKAVSEALHRVRAARQNLEALLAGAWSDDEAQQAVDFTITLLNRAAEWLEGAQ